MAAPILPLAAAAARAGARRRSRLGVKIAVAALVVLAATPVGFVACVAGIAGDTGEASPTTTPTQADVPGVPARAVAAYQAATSWCPALDWTLLAAIGEIESNHGQTAGANLDTASGEATPWIFGPILNGTGGTAAIPIGQWVGWWGLTGPWAQAVGPMQFLPATFTTYAVDADSDGTANPHDLDDAAATAASYICAISSSDVIGLEDAARIYNPGSLTYADELASTQQRISDGTRQAGAGGSGAATVCPVAGPVEFSDTWGAPRSGGRTHQGVDIFADHGTSVLAPENGTVEHYNNSLGGLSYRLYGDSGTYYYGTHLSAFENVGIGRVEAGTTIGYVGQTGNAATTPPHLHWEIHPTGRGSDAINPTPTAEALCR